MNSGYSLLLIAVMAGMTMLTRFLPFWVFPAGKKRPAYITYLSRVLPTAVIAMLVIYCLKDIHFTSVGGFIPELIAVLIVAILHIWKRQPLLSIGGGTICYMLLVQYIF